MAVFSIFGVNSSIVTCFTGIDIGTTHTKAVVITGDGKIIFETKKGYDLLHPEPGYEEQDVAAILAAVKDVMQEAIRSVRETYDIVSISFSAAMHSILPVDKNNEPLHNAIIWADTRSTHEAETIAGLPDAKTIIRNTGMPVHPMSPLCKIRWFKNNRPAIFAATHKFISIKEYIFYQLSGKYIVDYSVASATGLFNTKQKKWDPVALQAAGITEEYLSVPVSPLHVEYELTPAYRDLFQLNRHIAFVIGASDGCLANLGSGAILHGETALTIGTSGAVRTTLLNPASAGSETLFTYVLAEDIYVRGGAINNGGIVLSWLASLFLPETGNNESNIESLLLMAEKAAPGSGDLFFLPYLLGERAPVWDANAKAALVGLAMHHRKEHIIRAALEGICFALNQVIISLETSNGPIKEIYVSGGFVQSPFWIQLLANITGKKLRVTDTADASSIGAAYLGMYGTGHLRSLADIKKSIRIIDEYEPDQPVHKIYTERFRIFCSLYPQLKESFAALSSLQDN